MGAVASKQRGFETVGDMVRSIGLVLVAVAVAFAIGLWPKTAAVKVVEYGPVVEQARAVAPYELLAPTGLPTSWKATSMRYEPAAGNSARPVTTWHLGFVTAKDKYAAVEQTNGALDDVLKASLGAAHTDGSTQIAGKSWDRLESDNGKRRALLQVSGQVSVAVQGSASWQELEQLAGALRAS